jgi:23S rRNA pseudouridine1911/1915/1917 synthase
VLFQTPSDVAKNALFIANDMSDIDELIDLPETPEAASATPMSLRPGIVHRLDKVTSGVLIAAKSTDAVAKLSALFAQRKIRKVYLAICVGHPGETTLVEPIGRSQRNRQLMTVYEGPPGKPAVTHVRTICFDGKISAALVRIETGRTHQIRVHLKHRRTPILGDEDYGNREWNNKIFRSDKINRPLLHAYETEFEHPFTGAYMLIYF